MDLRRNILYGMHKEAERLAFAYYLRKGRVPPRITEILNATASPEAFDEYCRFNPDQPRAPAGTPEGGQWIDAGGEDDEIDDPPLRPVYPVETLLTLSFGKVAVTTAQRAISLARISWGLLRGTGGSAVEKTLHGAERFRERGFNENEVTSAIRTAKESGNVVERTGKYGTTQRVYNGANGITVIIETEGRNANKIITLFRRAKGGYYAKYAR